MARMCVVMCTYQGAQFLDEQLDSIAGQRRQPDSMVIVDDRSQDTTLSVVRAFAARAPFPVRVEENAENLGFIRNFERAIGFADEEVIVLADQDDVWLPNKLEEIDRAFATSPKAAAVFSDARLVDDSLQPLGMLLSQAVGFSRAQQRHALDGQMFEILIRGNVVTGATMAFRSEYRDRLLPVSDDIEHDAWIALVLSAIAPVVYIARPLILYRQHGGNQIGARRLSVPERFRRARRQRVDGLTRQRVRNAQVLERLASVNLAPERAAMLRQAISHLDLRAGLPERRSSRVLPVLREVASGRYRQMSHGLASACRDLLA